MEEKLRKWVDVANILATNPTAKVVCPGCGIGHLQIKDEPIPHWGNKIDRFMICKHCGKYEILTMEKPRICISTDVDISHLILHFHDLEGIHALNTSSLYVVPFIKINHYDLSAIRDELTVQIDNLLLVATTTPDKEYVPNRHVNKTMSHVFYRNKEVKVDFRSDTGFRISALVGIFNLIESCERLNGALHLFNRTLFERDKSLQLVNLLKSNGGKSLNEISNYLSGISRIDLEEIDTDALISRAQEHGFIGYDRILNRYFSTARGYMLR